MKNIITLLFSVILPLATYAGGANICADTKARAFFGDSKNLLPVTSLKNLTSNSQLVLLGELHGGIPGARAKILRSLQPEHNTCLFYELNRRDSIEQHLKKFSVPGYEESFREFSEIHAAAVALGLKEFTVEGDYPFTYDGSDLNPRDNMMAQRILELFEQGTCQRAVMFIGSDHVTVGTQGRRPLPHLLAEKLATYRIRLQEATDQEWIKLGSEYKSLMGWRGVCRAGQKLPVPKGLALFENKILSPSLKLNPFSEETGFWREFNATVLIGESVSSH